MAGLHKILIVEDNVELCFLYNQFLVEHGFDVVMANDGEEGLDLARSYEPDLIFLDVMMPKKDGFEDLKILRHDPTYKCTKSKIVILTNLGDYSKVSEEVRKDMDGYVIKAEIELDDLIKIINSFDV